MGYNLIRCALCLDTSQSKRGIITERKCCLDVLQPSRNKFSQISVYDSVGGHPDIGTDQQLSEMLLSSCGISGQCSVEMSINICLSASILDLQIDDFMKIIW